MQLKRRTFTEEFKQQLAEQVLRFNLSPTQLAREHNIHPVVLSRWIKKYRTGSTQNVSATKTTKEDLEALVGRLLIDNELLKKALKAVQEQQKRNEIISGTTEITLEQ